MTKNLEDKIKTHKERTVESFGYSTQFYEKYLNAGYRFVFDQHDEDEPGKRLVSEPTSDLQTCLLLNDDMKHFLPSYWEIYYKIDINNKIIRVYDAVTKDNLMV